MHRIPAARIGNGQVTITYPPAALSMQRPRPRGGYGVRTAGRYLWRITFACFGSSTSSGGFSLTSFAARVGGKVAQSSVS